MTVLLTFIDAVPLQEAVRDSENNAIGELSPELQSWLRNLVDTLNTNIKLIQDDLP